VKKKYFIAITIFFIILIMAPAVAFSQSLNLNLPQSPSSYQSDRFRHGDLDCSNAIGGSTNLEFGVVGLLEQQQQPFDTIGNTSNNVFGDYQKDVGVYARITIPLDKPKERINCNTLYKLALERERLEVQRLKAEVEQLKRLQFEND
jgi:hypothetical protein